jgi:hypothetical protein
MYANYAVVVVDLVKGVVTLVELIKLIVDDEGNLDKLKELENLDTKEVEVDFIKEEVTLVVLINLVEVNEVNRGVVKE